MVPGIVTAASKPKHKATHVTLQCRVCRATKTLPVAPGLGGVHVPRACDGGRGGRGKKNDAGPAGRHIPYLRVVGLVEEGEGARGGAPTFTPEEELAFRAFAASPTAVADVVGRIAPDIFGHADVKKAVACLMFGGSRKV